MNNLSKKLKIKVINLPNNNYAVVKDGIKLAEFKELNEALKYRDNYIPGQTSLL